MRISIGVDHAGLPLKNYLEDFFRKQGWFLIDRGAYSQEISDYPDFAHSVSKDVIENRADFGILVCGSGIGMSIAANRYRKIRAALCYNIQAASVAREHNDANILCLGARYLTPSDCIEIVNVFITTAFSCEERHKKRIEKIDQGE